jgi:hypothetical protein
MIVEMPFYHKFTGRSPNRSDIREIVCCDKDLMDLTEFSLSDFETGAHFGDGIGTLVKEGRHWAYFGTSTTGRLDNRPVDDFGRATAMRKLSDMIDTTRFFEGGRIKLKVNRLMSNPLPARWIESSERESILTQLREWVGENVAIIDGNLAIRVGEPSLRLVPSASNVHGVAALRVRRDALVPDLATHQSGIHFALDDITAMRTFAQKAVDTYARLDGWEVMLRKGTLESMKRGLRTDEHMHERSLRSIAASVVARGPRTRRERDLRHHFDCLDTLNDMPTGQTDDAELDRMMNHLSIVSPDVGQIASLMVELAAEQWEDRPVPAVAMDRRTPGMTR